MPTGRAPISAQRALPEWRRDVFSSDVETLGPADGREVVLFADTFNRAYERENLDAALRVLVEGGYRVHIPKPADGGRPLCCGRTFLSAGLVDHARAELDRLVTTYAPFALRGVRHLHVPDETELLEPADHPPRHVELPAPQPVTCRGRKRVMVVVPALAEYEHRDHPVVA